MSEEKKETFWTSPIGSKVAYLIHEHSNASCIIGSNISILRTTIKSGDISNEILLERLDRIETSLKRQKDAVDYAYTTIKKELGY